MRMDLAEVLLALPAGRGERPQSALQTRHDRARDKDKRESVFQRPQAWRCRRNMHGPINPVAITEIPDKSRAISQRRALDHAKRLALRILAGKCHQQGDSATQQNAVRQTGTGPAMRKWQHLKHTRENRHCPQPHWNHRIASKSNIARMPTQHDCSRQLAKWIQASPRGRYR